MRGGVIFLIVALLLAYVAVTGRYKCFSALLSCILYGDCGCPGQPQSPAGGQVGALPPIAPLPQVGSAAICSGPFECAPPNRSSEGAFPVRP